MTAFLDAYHKTTRSTHLYQLHNRNRVEEVQAPKPVSPLSGAGYLCHREGGGVSGEDRGAVCVRVCVGEGVYVYLHACANEVRVTNTYMHIHVHLQCGLKVMNRLDKVRSTQYSYM